MEVRLRVAYPLLQKHIGIEEEEIIVVTGFPQTIATSSAPPPSQPANKTPQVQSQQKQSQPVQQKTPVQQQVQLKAQQAPQQKTSQPQVQAQPSQQKAPAVQVQPKAQQATPQQVQPKAAQIPAQNPTPAKQSSQSQPAIANQPAQPAKASQSQPQVQTDDDEIDYNKFDFFFLKYQIKMLISNSSVDNMVSNDVLEWALAEVEKQILLQKKQNQPVSEELITKQQQIDMKLQILVIQIQSGQMSEEAYISMVEKKITEEKEIARKYIKENKKEAAQLALLRAKIMTKELEGEE